jgi:hypothetical protein
MKTLKIARKSIYQCWLMEKQTYYVNQSGISLNSEGGYTLEIKMDIQKNSDLRGKQGIDIILIKKQVLM